MKAAERVWRDYIKEHGWKVGWRGSGEGRVKYAMWRTGPNTATYVVDSPRSGDQVPWYLVPVQWGWQAIFIYIFLAPFAGIAAWYLSRKITRPVGRVAAASAVLAAGSNPDPIPVEGPAELATMARSFNRLAERLDEAEAAQREFVASVNHELKTPLTSLQGYGELLSDGAVSAEEAGPVVLAETTRLERLVGDLLDSARMGSGTFSVRDEEVSLGRVAEAVLQRYQGMARDFGIALEVREESPGEATVFADEDRLVQVVSNLVENALRCTSGDGSVRVVVHPPSTIRVVDTGPGLAPDELTRAFERFYLYEKCRSDRPVGTGLGLSIVEELTEAMGGSVSVTSEPGAGSVFSVELRVAEPAAAGVESGAGEA
jgi:two-component system, OmpR family, sensor kinase